MRMHWFQARAHVLAVFRGCSVLPAGRGGHSPQAGASDDDMSWAMNILLLPSQSCPAA